MPPMPVQDFEKSGRYKVDPNTGCWNWQRCCYPAGYPMVVIGGKNHFARRVVFAHYRGALPPGASLHNTCGRRLCVNPEHQRLRRPRTDYGRAIPHRRPPWRVDDNDCWIWMLQFSRDGEPLEARRFDENIDGEPQTKKKTVSARRAIYTDVIGPIPPGNLLRRCPRTRACVNPHHHELKTSFAELQEHE